MKQIPLTGQVMQAARASYGEDANLSQLVVFEATIATTGRMRKKGIYAGARMSETALSQIATMINSESRPLLMSHNDSTAAYGRVFAATRDPGANVVALFGIFSDQHPELISKLDSGTLDQVSVGLLPERLTCSECGFDYMGEDATWDHYMSATCSNGHSVGTDGVHVIVDSVDSFYEVSAVNQGGYSGARVRGPSNSVFAGTAALAASAETVVNSPFALYLEADEGAVDEPVVVDDEPVVVDESVEVDEPVVVDEPAPEAQMDLELTANAIARAVLTATSSVQTELVETRLNLTNQLSAANTANATLQASLTAAQTEMASLKAQLDKVKPDLLALASRTQVAMTGKATVKDTDDLDLMLSIIQDGNRRLSAVLPTGQRSGSSAAAPLLNNHSGRNNAAFVQG